MKGEVGKERGEWVKGEGDESKGGREKGTRRVRGKGEGTKGKGGWRGRGRAVRGKVADGAERADKALTKSR